MTIDRLNLLNALVPVVRDAGAAIMDVYRRQPRAELKGDGSPVTEADRAAEALIVHALEKYAPEIAIVSEENATSHELKPSGPFFLVDPLDGTREFIKQDGKGCFTVNIALIDNATPVLGIVYAPMLDRLFTGIDGEGAFENGRPIASRSDPRTRSVAVASASHRDEETDRWLSANDVAETLSVGSSLKFGLLACGEADIYPRFGPTMEWDTAAGHAILAAAGGWLENPDGTPFVYGKPGYRNGPFVAGSRKWRQL